MKAKEYKFLKLNINKAALVLCAGLCVLTLTGCTTKTKQQQALLKTGQEQMANGQYEDAIVTYNKALQKSTGTVGVMEKDLCYYKAAAQYASGDFNGALDTYTALVNYDSKNSDPLFLRGTLYARSKQIDHAMEDYKAAIALSEDDYELYINIYENLCAFGFRDQASEILNMALEVEGDRGENYMQRGRIYIILGQTDAANKVLEKAIERKCYEAYIYLAELKYEQGDTEGAYADISSYKESKDISAKGVNAIAEMEIRQGNYQSAMEYIESGLAMEGASMKKQLLRNQIACYEYTSDFAKAYELCQEYLKQYPGDESMLRELLFLQSR